MDFNKEDEDYIAQCRERASFVEISDLEDQRFYWFYAMTLPESGYRVTRRVMIPGYVVMVNGAPLIFSSFCEEDRPWTLESVTTKSIFGAQRLSLYQEKVTVARMWERAGNDTLAYKIWGDAQDLMTSQDWARRAETRTRLFGSTPPVEWKPKRVHEMLDAALADLGIDTNTSQVENGAIDRLLALVGLQRIAKDNK